MQTLGTMLAACSCCGIVAGIALATATGCEDKPSKPPAVTAPKAEEQSAMVDPEIAKAIGAAPAASAARADEQDQGSGPPQSGVFTSAQADVTHALGAPIFVEVAALGDEPRVSLKPTSYDVPKNLSFTIATMMGQRRSLPTVDLTFGFSLEKPKAPSADDAPATSMFALSTVTSAKLSARQPGQVPAEVGLEVAKIKDSRMRVSLESAGGLRILSIDRSEKALPELEHNLMAVAEALAASCVAVPEQPVGVGATWIARSRDAYGGVDIISYRVAKVAKIEGEVVTLTVETRQYAAGENARKAGIPEGTLVQFESAGGGEVLLRAGQRFPSRISFTHGMKLSVRATDAFDNQVAQVFFQSTTTYPVDK